MPPPEPPVIEIPLSVSGIENLPVRIPISARVPGERGNEGLNVYIENVPMGSSFSRGSLQDNRWLFTPQDFGVVELSLPQDISGRFAFEIVATFAGSSRQRSVIVYIQPSIDRPAISIVTPVCYNLTSQNINIPISIYQVEDINNYLIIFSGIPNITFLSSLETNQSSDSGYSLNAADVYALEIIEVHYHGDFEAFTFDVVLLTKENLSMVTNVSIDVALCVDGLITGKILSLDYIITYTLSTLIHNIDPYSIATTDEVTGIMIMYCKFNKAILFHPFEIVSLDYYLYQYIQ